MSASWSQGLYTLIALPVVLVIIFIIQTENLIQQQHKHQHQFIVKRSRKVFADLTSNKLTREHDGSYGLWSYHGIAKKSHASQTEFIYNADLLSDNDRIHTSIASTVYPLMGLTSDRDPIYQEYLILQAKTAGIDGFIMEWGYQEHPSNTALLSLLTVVQKYKPFSIGINWCDHWLTIHMENRSSEEVVDKFHQDLQYLYDNVFSIYTDLIPMYGNHPIIFLFGDGLPTDQFTEVLRRPLNLPGSLDTPVWIGNYQYVASSPEHWAKWKKLINGTYGWVPDVKRSTPPSMSEWDYYSTTEDIMTYQQIMSDTGLDCISNVPGCVMWCGSVSPGMDNRGSAGWGRSLRYIPRWNDTTNISSNDIQWNFYLSSKTQPDVMILPTMNDFPEATTILPLQDSAFQTLHSTANYTSTWKNTSIDMTGITLPMLWFQAYKEVEFYNRTPELNVSSLFPLLEATTMLIDKQDFFQANKTLQSVRENLSKCQQRLSVDILHFQGPSKDLFETIPSISIGNASYINSTRGVFLALTEDHALMLRKHNYKGLLRFEYQLQEANFSRLLVKSSSKRHSVPSSNPYVFYSRSSRSHPGYKVHTDYAEVCDIMTKTSGLWSSAVVKLYKTNQAWDHSYAHQSDLHFAADAQFLIRNISLNFELYRLKNSMER